MKSDYTLQALINIAGNVYWWQTSIGALGVCYSNCENDHPEDIKKFTVLDKDGQRCSVIDCDLVPLNAADATIFLNKVDQYCDFRIKKFMLQRDAEDSFPSS